MPKWYPQVRSTRTPRRSFTDASSPGCLLSWLPSPDLFGDQSQRTKTDIFWEQKPANQPPTNLTYSWRPQTCKSGAWKSLGLPARKSFIHHLKKGMLGIDHSIWDQATNKSRDRTLNTHSSRYMQTMFESVESKKTRIAGFKRCDYLVVTYCSFPFIFRPRWMHRPTDRHFDVIFELSLTVSWYMSNFVVIGTSERTFFVVRK